MPRILSNKGVGNFLSGVLSLTASTVVVKIIGLIYKIPMLSLVGGEGMGYFNSAYEIYSLLCIVSITGLPVAMSVIISHGRDRRRADGVLDLSLKIFTLLGVIFAIALVIFSRGISQGIKSERAYFSILAIAPSIVFVCMSSAYKGYFQGLSDMRPICISGIVEAASKLIFGLLLAMIASKAGYPNYIVAAFGIFSISLGSLFSLIYFIIYKRKKDKKEGIKISRPYLLRDEVGRVAIDLIKISFPATLSSLMISLTRMIDMVMILRRLQSIGYSSESANMMYGSYTAMAIPIFSLASALVSSVAIPLIPELSGAISRGDESGQGERMSCAISLTSFIACPAMIGISLFSREILSLIFSSQTEGIRIVTPLLAILGPSVLTSVLITLTNSMLQAYRQASKPIISMGVGCVLKIIISFFLLGNRRINILGAPIGTYVCDLAICVLNFAFLFKYYRGRISFKSTVFIPAICSACAILPVFFVMRCVQGLVGWSSIYTIVAIAVSGVIYLILTGRKILKLKDLGD